ncbi:hypothetical protein OSTOST_13419 [Ostertagia ostertagi]
MRKSSMRTLFTLAAGRCPLVYSGMASRPVLIIRGGSGAVAKSTAQQCSGFHRADCISFEMAKSSADRGAIISLYRQDPFEFDLYDEPTNDSEDAFNRMATLCARLQKRTTFPRDRKASPLVFRLCDMLN